MIFYLLRTTARAENIYASVIGHCPLQPRCPATPVSKCPLLPSEPRFEKTLKIGIAHGQDQIVPASSSPYRIDLSFSKPISGDAHYVSVACLICGSEIYFGAWPVRRQTRLTPMCHRRDLTRIHICIIVFFLGRQGPLTTAYRKQPLIIAGTSQIAILLLRSHTINACQPRALLFLLHCPLLPDAPHMPDLQAPCMSSN